MSYPNTPSHHSATDEYLQQRANKLNIRSELNDDSLYGSEDRHHPENYDPTSGSWDYAAPQTKSLDSIVTDLCPEEVRWFYKSDGEKRWSEFSGYDSLRIEMKFREISNDPYSKNSAFTDSPSYSSVLKNSNFHGSTASNFGMSSIKFPSKTQPNQQYSSRYPDSQLSHKIVVRGGLYEVSFDSWKCASIYWPAEEYAILRGIWFYEGTWQPLEREQSEILETRHLQMFKGHKLGEHAANEEKGIVMHTETFPEFIVEWFSPNSIYLYSETKPSKIVRSVTTRLGFHKSTGYRLFRSYKTESNLDDRPDVEITHLVFVIHGIGQKMDTGRIIRNTSSLRDCVSWLKQKYFPNSPNHRAEFFPVEWRSNLQLDGDLVDTITPNTLASLRQMLNSSAMDIMYYTSPLYGGEVQRGLREELNRLFSMFTARNPYFLKNGGKVSVIAHSLGCVILYDIIMGLKPGSLEPSTEQGLLFQVENFFCLGSPLSVFLALRYKDIVTPERMRAILPPRLCRRLYNIFHPTDPVAYRMEPLLSKEYCRIAPLVIHAYNASFHTPYSEMPIEFLLPEQTKDPSVQNSSANMGNMPREEISPGGTPRGQDDASKGSWSIWGLMKGPKQNMDGSRLEIQGDLEYRLDYMLRGSNLGVSYLSALTSHTAYWGNNDVAYFVLTQIFKEFEKMADRNFPMSSYQHNLPIDSHTSSFDQFNQESHRNIHTAFPSNLGTGRNHSSDSHYVIDENYQRGLSQSVYSNPSLQSAQSNFQTPPTSMQHQNPNFAQSRTSMQQQQQPLATSSMQPQNPHFAHSLPPTSLNQQNLTFAQSQPPSSFSQQNTNFAQSMPPSSMQLQNPNFPQSLPSTSIHQHGQHFPQSTPGDFSQPHLSMQEQNLSFAQSQVSSYSQQPNFSQVSQPSFMQQQPSNLNQLQQTGYTHSQHPNFPQSQASEGNFTSIQQPNFPQNQPQLSNITQQQQRYPGPVRQLQPLQPGFQVTQNFQQQQQQHQQQQQQQHSNQRFPPQQQFQTPQQPQNLQTQQIISGLTKNIQSKTGFFDLKLSDSDKTHNVNSPTKSTKSFFPSFNLSSLTSPVKNLSNSLSNISNQMTNMGSNKDIAGNVQQNSQNSRTTSFLGGITQNRNTGVQQQQQVQQQSNAPSTTQIQYNQVGQSIQGQVVQMSGQNKGNVTQYIGQNLTYYQPPGSSQSQVTSGVQRAMSHDVFQTPNTLRSQPLKNQTNIAQMSIRGNIQPRPSTVQNFGPIETPMGTVKSKNMRMQSKVSSGFDGQRMQPKVAPSFENQRVQLSSPLENISSPNFLSNKNQTRCVSPLGQSKVICSGSGSLGRNVGSHALLSSGGFDSELGLGTRSLSYGNLRNSSLVSGSSSYGGLRSGTSGGYNTQSFVGNPGLNRRTMSRPNLSSSSLSGSGYSNLPGAGSNLAMSSLVYNSPSYGGKTYLNRDFSGPSSR